MLHCNKSFIPKVFPELFKIEDTVCLHADHVNKILWILCILKIKTHFNIPSSQNLMRNHFIHVTWNCFIIKEASSCYTLMWSWSDFWERNWKATDLWIISGGVTFTYLCVKVDILQYFLIEENISLLIFLPQWFIFEKQWN